MSELNSKKFRLLYSFSSSSFFSVGLCLGDFALRCLVVGVARVDGGSPIFSRAAALTAEVALKGLSLRGFDGIVFLPESHPHLSAETQLTHGCGAGLRCGSRGGWTEDGRQYE
jgi:hypothetical protein